MMSGGMLGPSPMNQTKHLLSPDKSRQSTSPISVKKNIPELSKENINLKSKITTLETEVKSLTYY